MRWSKALACAVWLSALPVLSAAQPADRENEDGAWYVVRPGENLRVITERYLGDQERWQEIWRLNPEIENPNFLVPGQRIRVRVRQLPAHSARLRKIQNRVDENPQPLGWAKAETEDLLLVRDGLRTEASSSAELELSNGDSLKVTESSLLFLREGPLTVENQAPRRPIEIVRGQADLEGGRPSSRSADVELILGPATARPRPAAGSPPRARARRIEDGGAQVMLYEGEGQVAAAGEEVQLARGTGTSVAEEGPPSPPERLLDAPALEGPAAGSRLSFSNPIFTWGAVPKAKDYVVEICADAGCGRLIYRQVGIEGTQWQPASLPLGDLFWRATARSQSGLDGYPAETAALSVLRDQPDQSPPLASFKWQGTVLEEEGALVLGPGARFELAAEDEESGVAERVVVLDGKEAGPDGLEEALAGPWSPGPHRLEGRVRDAVGRSAVIPPVDFVYDPQKPVVNASFVGRGWHGEEGLGLKAWPVAGSPPPPPSPEKERRGWRRKGPSGPAVLEWSGAGRSWRRLEGRLQVLGNPGNLLFRVAPGAGPLRVEGLEEAISGDRWLRLSFSDGDGSGIERTTFGVETGAEGRALVITTEDRLGNEGTERFPLTSDR